MSDPAPAVRPLRADEFSAFLERSKETYAADMIAAGVDPEVARTKSERDHAALLADGVDTDGQLLFAIDDPRGERAGILWLAEREGDLGRSLFVYGLEIDEGHRGRGLGRAAMLFAEDEARRRGLPRVALNVFGGNDVARSLYRSLGYTETAVYMEKPA